MASNSIPNDLPVFGDRIIYIDIALLVAVALIVLLWIQRRPDAIGVRARRITAGVAMVIAVLLFFSHTFSPSAWGPFWFRSLHSAHAYLFLIAGLAAGWRIVRTKPPTYPVVQPQHKNFVPSETFQWPNRGLAGGTVDVVPPGHFQYLVVCIFDDGHALRDQYNGPIDLEETSLPESIKQRLSSYAETYEALGIDKWASPKDHVDDIYRLDMEGLSLMREIKSHYGNNAKVGYFSDGLRISIANEDELASEIARLKARC